MTVAALLSGAIWVYKWKGGTTAEQQIHDVKNELFSLNAGIEALARPWSTKDLEPDIQRLLSEGNIRAAQTLLQDRVKVLATKKASYSYALARIALLQLDESAHIAHLTNAVSEDPVNAPYIVELYDALTRIGKTGEARGLVETALRRSDIEQGPPRAMLELTLALDKYPLRTLWTWRRMYEICPVRDGKTFCPFDKSAAVESAALIATLQDAERSLVGTSISDPSAPAILYFTYRLLVMLHDIRDEVDLSEIYDTRSQTLLAEISRESSPWRAWAPAMQSLLIIHLSEPRRVRPYLSSLLELSEHLTDTKFPATDFAPMTPREARAVFRSQVFFHMALHFDKYGGPHQVNRAMELAISELEDHSMPSISTILLRPVLMYVLLRFYEQHHVSNDKILTLRSKMTAALSALPNSALKEELATTFCSHDAQLCVRGDRRQAALGDPLRASRSGGP